MPKTNFLNIKMYANDKRFNIDSKYKNKFQFGFIIKVYIYNIQLF